MTGGFTGGFPARRAAGRPYPAPGRGLPVLATVQSVNHPLQASGHFYCGCDELFWRQW
jgi:hypothetical protein